MTLEPDVRDIRGACPLDCPDTCGWIVTVKGTPTRTQRASGTPPAGEAVALRGDPAHPYTRGSLCNKVADYLNYARSSKRVLYPMRRVGPKGSGEFIRISWDEAHPPTSAGIVKTFAVCSDAAMSQPSTRPMHYIR